MSGVFLPKNRAGAIASAMGLGLFMVAWIPAFAGMTKRRTGFPDQVGE